MILNTILAFLVYKMKGLTLKGVILAWFIGVFLCIFCFKGYCVLLAYYLIISIIEKFILKKTDQRTPLQIFANVYLALYAIIFYIFFKHDDYFVIYCILLSVSMSDTLASDFGTRFAKRIYSIANFKEINRGLSGGISFIGTLSGFIGAFVMASIYLIVCIAARMEYSLLCFFEVGLLGFLGMLVDSLLGALFQKKYLCPSCHMTSDHRNCCDVEGSLIGKGVLNNTQVNVISEGLIFILCIFLFPLK